MSWSVDIAEKVCYNQNNMLQKTTLIQCFFAVLASPNREAKRRKKSFDFCCATFVLLYRQGILGINYLLKSVMTYVILIAYRVGKR